MISDHGRRIYEANTLRDTPRASFRWSDDRSCRTTNEHDGKIYSVDVIVFDNGSFCFDREKA